MDFMHDFFQNTSYISGAFVFKAYFFNQLIPALHSSLMSLYTTSWEPATFLQKVSRGYTCVMIAASPTT